MYLMLSSKVSERKPVWGCFPGQRGKNNIEEEVNSGDWRVHTFQCVGKGEAMHEDDMKLKVFECKECTVLLRSFVLAAKLTSLEDIQLGPPLEGPASRGGVQTSL